MLSSNDLHFYRDMKRFFYLGSVSFILDIALNNKNYKKCPKIYPVLFFHHFIWLFALFGWLSNNKSILKIFCITIIIYLTHWKVNNNKCFITEWIKENCNLSEKYGLQVITNHFKLKIEGREDHKKLLYFYLLIAIAKLFN